MKTFRRIQIIVAIVAIVTALSISDGSDATRTEIWSAIVMIATAILTLLSKHFYAPKKD